MKLHVFIRGHIEAILEEWVSFAQTLIPVAGTMSIAALRDHAKGILEAIALDMATRQDPAEQYDKSRGHGADVDDVKASAASVHGAQRQASDFSLIQLSSEFRALRATVLRMWLPRIDRISPDAIYEMVRFNEAIDQALAESIVTYSAGADHARELFLAVLGHDLRAPLSTMSLAAALLGQASVEPGQVAQIGVRVGRASRLMTSMVNDLLGYTRTQLGGGMPVVLRPTNVADVCRAAVEDASATHPDTRFETELSGLLTGELDGVRLHQMITNLLVNAAQYGASGRPVRLEAKGSQESLLVRVTNHGTVIPAASLQSIFRPMVQLPEAGADEDSRPRTSLGLGLFVAREIAAAHGGTIEVESNESEGTRFTVDLPR